MSRANKHIVRLSYEEYLQVDELASNLRISPLLRRRARILLAVSDPDDEITDEQAATLINCPKKAVARLRRSFDLYGLESVLYHRPRTGAPRLLSPEQESLLVDLYASPPPKPFAKWPMPRLLEEFIRRDGPLISDQTVVRTLTKYGVYSGGSSHGAGTR